MDEGSVANEAVMMTFVVRLTRDKVGRITGIVEQVKTGLKARVDGLDAVGRTIGEMIGPRGRVQSCLRQEVRDEVEH